MDTGAHLDKFMIMENAKSTASFTTYKILVELSRQPQIKFNH